MVKVNVPLDTPLDEGSGDEDEVGVMSDIVESDLDDDIDDPDWEEVKSNKDDDEDEFPMSSSKSAAKMPALPANGVTISIGRPRRGKRSRKSKNGEDDDEAEQSGSENEEDLVAKKKKKRAVDLNEMVRKSINKVKITNQVMKHKLSLLLYLARGFRLVKIVRCNVISGLSLSIVDSRFQMKKVGRKKQSDRDALKQFTDTFLKVIELSTDEDKQDRHMQQPFMLNLLDCYATLEATSLLEFVVMFCSCLKALKPQLPMRIINVLRPITFRANIIPKPADGKPFEPPKNWEQNEEDNSAGSSGVVEKLDYWVEVYLEDEKRWCCVDLCNEGRLDEPLVLTELNRPFYYLVAYDLDRNCVKSVEKNYCEDWYLPSYKKGRCDDKWWQMVMSRLGPVKSSEKDQADEVKNDELLTKQEMPTSDNGFRNHPLYVLQKHLLKFQAIYPPEVPPLGFFKEQPVYPRDCVQTCCSRETWLRQAKTVKLGESPYKIVTARPKRDKYTGELIKDLPLELFGSWQTEAYDPPAAKDGKVPRNCYGNVDMYQPEMLPKGCAWLKLPGLPRVANKLGIDCAAAVVGFDQHCGGGYGAHPVIDGFIVCEEHADTLRMAWEEHQENSRRREEEKRSKRIWDNWRRLLKAAMIREKLRVKYKNS